MEVVQLAVRSAMCRESDWREYCGRTNSDLIRQETGGEEGGGDRWPPHDRAPRCRIAPPCHANLRIAPSRRTTLSSPLPGRNTHGWPQCLTSLCTHRVATGRSTSQCTRRRHQERKGKEKEREEGKER
uniref:Uncharacterized protein n=1 Tax=Oryza meridionalis TaxID=40149 RepID=A0A0E0EPT3_9ORYZ